MKKTLTNSIGALAILCAGFIYSCQNEENDISLPDETLTKSAELTSLLQRVAAADSVSDNAVDSTSCFRIKRPYQVHIDQGINQPFTATVANDEDQVYVNNLIGNMTTTGTWSLVFPVTVIFADGTEQEVTNFAEFDLARMQCDPAGGATGSTDPIGCISINYPITVYSYNSDQQLAETYTIHSDTELLFFLLTLDTTQFYALDYPVSVTLAGTTQLTVHNNAEMLAAINQAIGYCIQTPIDPCDTPVTLGEGLILYMPFGNEARELISNTALSHNDNYPPQLVADRDGNAHAALQFSGNPHDYLWLAETAQNHIQQGDSLSISLWFRMENDNGSDFECFFKKSQDVNTYTYPFFVGAYDLNKPLFASLYGGQNTNLWDQTFPGTSNSEWHHLVFTLNGSTQLMSLYRNGVLVASDATTTGINVGNDFFNYFLGYLFKGSLDDVRIYRKLLTADDVGVLYNLDGDMRTCL